MPTSTTHNHLVSDEDDDAWSCNFRAGLVDLAVEESEEEEDASAFAESDNATFSKQTMYEYDLASIDPSLVEETVSFKETPFTIAARNTSIRRSRLADAVKNAAVAASPPKDTHTVTSAEIQVSPESMEAPEVSATAPTAPMVAMSSQPTRFLPISSHFKPKAREGNEVSPTSPRLRRSISVSGRGLSPISEATTVSTPSSSPGRFTPPPPMKRRKTQLDLTSKKRQENDQQTGTSASAAVSNKSSTAKPPLLPARVAFERPKRGRQSKLRLEGLPPPAAESPNGAQKRIQELPASAGERIHEPSDHERAPTNTMDDETSGVSLSSPKSGPAPNSQEIEVLASLPESTAEGTVAPVVVHEEAEFEEHPMEQGASNLDFISAAELLRSQDGHYYNAPPSPPVSGPVASPSPAPASRPASPSSRRRGPIRFAFESPGHQRNKAKSTVAEDFTFDLPVLPPSLPTPDASSSSVQPLAFSRRPSPSAFMHSTIEEDPQSKPSREMYASVHRGWQDAVPITINQATARESSPLLSESEHWRAPARPKFSLPISPLPSLAHGPQRFSSPPPVSFSSARSSQRAPSPSQWSTLWASSLGQHGSTAKMKSRVGEGESVARSLVAQEGTITAKRTVGQASKVTQKGRILAARKFRLPLLPFGAAAGPPSSNGNIHGAPSQDHSQRTTSHESASQVIRSPAPPPRRRSSTIQQSTQRTIGTKRITLFQPTPLAIEEREARERRAREAGHSEQDAFWLT